MFEWVSFFGFGCGNKKPQIDVYLAYRTGEGFPCPECGEPSPVHDTKTRTWKHLKVSRL